MTTVLPKNNTSVEDVFNAIRGTRKTEYINNFWRDLSYNERELRETWSQVKSVMYEGSVPYLYKEMIYVAVSIMKIAIIVFILIHSLLEKLECQMKFITNLWK